MPVGEDPAAHGHWCAFTDVYHVMPCLVLVQQRAAPTLSCASKSQVRKHAKTCALSMATPHPLVGEGRYCSELNFEHA